MDKKSFKIALLTDSFCGKLKAFARLLIKYLEGGGFTVEEVTENQVCALVGLAEQGEKRVLLVGDLLTMGDDEMHAIENMEADMMGAEDDDAVRKNLCVISVDDGTRRDDESRSQSFLYVGSRQSDGAEYDPEVSDMQMLYENIYRLLEEAFADQEEDLAVTEA